MYSDAELSFLIPGACILQTSVMPYSVLTLRETVMGFPDQDDGSFLL
jgi:hypothetical protein